MTGIPFFVICGFKLPQLITESGDLMETDAKFVVAESADSRYAARLSAEVLSIHICAKSDANFTYACVFVEDLDTTRV